MQVIEGDAGAVRAVMASIAQDNRHDSIMYLADAEATTRQFENWSLCCVGFEENLTASQLLDDVKLKVADVADPRLVASFIGFALLAKRV